MPGRDHAGEWVMRARRYVIARQALDTIETAALLEPRTQPQPAGATAAQRRAASAARAGRPGSR